MAFFLGEFVYHRAPVELNYDSPLTLISGGQRFAPTEFYLFSCIIFY